MTVKDLRYELFGIPGDTEVNIVSTGFDPEIDYVLDRIIFDSVDNLFIEVHEKDLISDMFDMGIMEGTIK